MKTYETIVVFSPTLDDRGVLEETKKIKQTLDSSGASEVVAEGWGKRELSFRIARQRFGIYICFRYSGSGKDIVNEVQRALILNENVLRFQTMVTSNKKRKFKGQIRSVPRTDDFDDYGYGDRDYQSDYS